MVIWKNAVMCSKRSHSTSGEFLRTFLLLSLSLLHPSQVEGQGPYYGKLIGPLTSLEHNVAGMVYAVNETTIFIKDFTYDGEDKNTIFWMGSGTDVSKTGTIIVPHPGDPNKESPSLIDYNKAEVLLRLPTDKKIKDFEWLSVWNTTANFGSVKIPKDLQVPTILNLGSFQGPSGTKTAHGLASGPIIIQNTHTFYIPGLHYDGLGPAAYFWTGETGDQPDHNGKRVPDELGNYNSKLRAYSGENINVFLPNERPVSKIRYLGIWCEKVSQNFGQVRIPKELNVPPFLSRFEKVRPRTRLRNCMDIEINNVKNMVQIQWELFRNDTSFIIFRLSARIKRDEWVGLGFSAEKSTSMKGADAVVAYCTKDCETFHADDYFLSDRAQCDGIKGACPDIRSNGVGVNNVKLLRGGRNNGVTSVEFIRPLKASEPIRDLSLEGEEVNIFAAIGPLNDQNEVHAHSPSTTGHTAKEKSIRISPNGIDPVNDCPIEIDELPEVQGAEVKPWEPIHIKGVKTFTAKIGPSGGRRGYSALTGQTGWGISWWLNDQMVPEIYVKRGDTITFKINGGNDSLSARYHPFYITDDKHGGLDQKGTLFEINKNQKVFIGVEYDAQGNHKPTAVGPFCEYNLKNGDTSEESETFEDYKKTVNTNPTCQDGKVLEWKVAADTPDLVYYQCYTHRNLGWKIHVSKAGSSLPDFVFILALLVFGLSSS